MKKVLFAVALIATTALGGCASFQAFEQNVQTAWAVATSASVSPTQIIIAGNTFDALEATATQYLGYCKANPAISQCALSTRQKTVAAVRAGRAARNALEPYVVSGTAGPAAVYNTLVAAIASLQNSNMVTGN